MMKMVSSGRVAMQASRRGATSCGRRETEHFEGVDLFRLAHGTESAWIVLPCRATARK